VAGVATSFATEQLIPVQFLCRQGCLARKIVVELRREGTDAVRTFVCGNRLREFVEIFICESAVGWAELKRSWISFKDSSARWRAAYLLNVRRPANFQRAHAEDLLKKELVLAQ